MKKGYEIQKISVINHLDRYLLEAGANDELLSLIIDSMNHWDDNMQIECANSFIVPIQQNLIDQKNKQKILKFAVDLVGLDENASNEKLTEPWYAVFDVLVAKVELDFAIKQIFPVIMELSGLKNPFPKRKRGNRLVASFAKQVGEEGFDKEPLIIKIIMGICHDNNYKIRTDGVLFFKEYLKNERAKTNERFGSVYIPELIELLNDEESYIRIEALEIMTDFLDYLEPSEVETEFMQAFLRTMDVGIEEITIRLAQMLGKIVHALKQLNNSHVKYQEQFIEFFTQNCQHKEVEMRRHGAYNLPCFNQLFKDQANQFGLDFQDLYLQFAKEEDSFIKKTIAASIHEAFALTSQDEDTQKLRDAFKLLCEDNNKDVLIGLTERIDAILLNYSNEHALKVYAPKLLAKDIISVGNSTPINREPTSSLQLSKGSISSELSTAMLTKNSKEEKKSSSKKVPQTPVSEPNKDEEQAQLLNIILPEYLNEIIFSDLLLKLIVFDQNLQNQHGLWRNQIRYLHNMSKVIHLFNTPEIHDALIPSLFDYIRGGNQEIRQAASECVSKILQYQYHNQKRQELIQSIKTDLAESNSCVLRKTFIYFCKSAVNCFSRQLFKQHFLNPYLALSRDKIATVRMEFAHSVVAIKPYLDHDINLNLELIDILNRLKTDPDRDVVEAVEHCDYKLLQKRKQTKDEEKLLNQQDQQRVDHEAKLVQREIREEEERKKRMEEEEELKFDFQTLLAESSKKFKRGKFSNFNLGRKGFGGLTSKPLNSGTSSIKSSVTSTVQGTITVDKTPTKKKPANSSAVKKSEANPGGSLSKNSLLPPTGSGLAEKKLSANSLSTYGDFSKRHSVLVTSSSSSMAQGGVLAASGGGKLIGAGSSGPKQNGRKSSTLGNE